MSAEYLCLLSDNKFYTYKRFHPIQKSGSYQEDEEVVTLSSENATTYLVHIDNKLYRIGKDGIDIFYKVTEVPYFANVETDSGLD